MQPRKNLQITPIGAVYWLRPCASAAFWLSGHANESPAKLYETCSRSDWLMWLAARVGVSPYLRGAAARDLVWYFLKHHTLSHTERHAFVDVRDALTHHQKRACTTQQLVEDVLRDVVHKHGCFAAEWDSPLTILGSIPEVFFEIEGHDPGTAFTAAVDCRMRAMATLVGKARVSRVFANMVLKHIPYSVVEPLLRKRAEELCRTWAEEFHKSA